MENRLNWWNQRSSKLTKSTSHNCCSQEMRKIRPKTRTLTHNIQPQIYYWSSVNHLKETNYSSKGLTFAKRLSRKTSWEQSGAFHRNLRGSIWGLNPFGEASLLVLGVAGRWTLKTLWMYIKASTWSQNTPCALISRNTILQHFIVDFENSKRIACP